jgi:hypothetical protein
LVWADPAEAAGGKYINQELHVKLQFHKTILFSACLLACPSLMISQERPGSQPKPAQSEAESLNKVLTSQEEDLEQAHHRIAAIYREMAVV